jgi:hypothetical protein
MTTEWTTESIVREVLRRLSQFNASQSTLNPHHSPPNSDALQLNERVISLAVIDGKLEGVKRIVVTDRAIITPAARDELKRRNIAFDRDDTPKEKRLALLLMTSDPKICLRQWKKNVNACETFRAQSAAEIASQAAKWVDRRHVVVAWSPRPLGLTCLLNKHAAIRAVAAEDERLVTRAVEEAGANVLVLNSSTIAEPSWSRWIEQFCSGTDRLETTESR